MIDTRGARRWDLTRREGWRRFVLSERRDMPEALSASELSGLSERALEDYNERRHDHHANFGVIRTPQLERAHDLMTMVLDTGLRVDSDRVKPSVVVDAEPGVGKTTTVNEYLREFERMRLRRLGDRTDSGHARIPVCRIGMTAKSGLRPLVASLLRFYGGPKADPESYRRNELYEMLMDYVQRNETEIIAVDDLHFLDPYSRDGQTVSNFLKGWSNDLGVALIMAGVDLAGRGLYTDGKMAIHATQNGRRSTPVGLSKYGYTGKHAKREWKDLLGAYESKPVLSQHQHSDLVSQAALIHERTQGYLVSLNHLITLAAAHAIRSRQERITEEILRLVPLDFAAEQFWEQRVERNLAA